VPPALVATSWPEVLMLTFASPPIWLDIQLESCETVTWLMSEVAPPEMSEAVPDNDPLLDPLVHESEIESPEATLLAPMPVYKLPKVVVAVAGPPAACLSWKLDVALVAEDCRPNPDRTLPPSLSATENGVLPVSTPLSISLVSPVPKVTTLAVTPAPVVALIFEAMFWSVSVEAMLTWRGVDVPVESCDAALWEMFSVPERLRPTIDEDWGLDATSQEVANCCTATFTFPCIPLPVPVIVAAALFVGDGVYKLKSLIVEMALASVEKVDSMLETVPRSLSANWEACCWLVIAVTFCCSSATRESVRELVLMPETNPPTLIVPVEDMLVPIDSLPVGSHRRLRPRT